VLGCVAQQEGEKIFERAPHVSLVAGSASYTRLGEMLVQLEAGNRHVTGLSLDTEEAFDTPFTRRDNPHRAYITIIEGCDKSCAYCVVPFTRGPERSRTSESVMAEARGLAGRATPKSSCWGRTSTAIAILRPPAGISRRCWRGWPKSRHPPRALHHLAPARFRARHRRRHGFQPRHLRPRAPAGAIGSSKVLAAMDRLYTRDEYMRRIDWIKSAKRKYSLTTDIIVGFPGETEEDFEQTLRLLDEVQYDSLFSFKYSPRPNTAALAMEDKVPEEEKQRRLVILQEKQRAIQIRRNAETIGSVREVLVEGRHESLGQWIGRTSDNRTLNFSHPDTGGKVADRLLPAGPRDALRPQLIGGRERNCGVMRTGRASWKSK
jgi:tRNA-2-methylthio-N6-dimethylallyladenosine synthase